MGLRIPKSGQELEMDPLQEWVPVKEWSIRTNNENQIFSGIFLRIIPSC
jgi:hypothetical protein